MYGVSKRMQPGRYAEPMAGAGGTHELGHPPPPAGCGLAGGSKLPVC